MVTGLGEDGGGQPGPLPRAWEQGGISGSTILAAGSIASPFISCLDRGPEIPRGQTCLAALGCRPGTGVSGATQPLGGGQAPIAPCLPWEPGV